MKTAWLFRGLLIAAALAFSTVWSAGSMAQIAPAAKGPPDKWGLTDFDYSAVDGPVLLRLSNAASRFDEIIAASNAGDPKAMLLICLGYDEGIWDIKSANYASGYCRSSALTKFPRGMRDHARYLELGTNGTPDKAAAAKLYHEAMMAGNALATADYGRAIEGGWDGPVDLTGAAIYYCAAADAGVRYANNNCGWALQHGWKFGVVNLEGAAAYYKKGAEAGDPETMAQYGFVLETGTGTPKNQCEATRWHRAAAEAGDVTGMENYALALEAGRCTPTDYQGALDWYERAIEAGSTKAGGLRDRLLVALDDLYSPPPPPPPQRNYQEWCLSHHAC